jgi:hypothetical protein
VTPERELEGGFSRRVLGWVIGIAVASFLAALLLSAFGENLSSWTTPDANSFSYSAIGHHALIELLSSLGLGVVPRQSRGVTGLGPHTPLVLAEPDVLGPPAVLDRIAAGRDEARQAKAALVLVLPKWQGEPGGKVNGWVGAVALRNEAEIAEVFAALGEPALQKLPLVRNRGLAVRRECEAHWKGAPERFTIEVDLPQLLAPAASKEPALEPPLEPPLESVITCGGQLLVGRRLLTPEGPELLVIADPDVLNNQGLSRGDHALLVSRLFQRHLDAHGVIFDETIHGFVRSHGLLAEAFRFPLLPASLQTFLLAGIVLWAGMGRFGKPMPPPGGLAAGKDVLIDNTATLLLAGGHTADSLARYHRQTEQAVAASLFLSPGLSSAEMRRRIEDVAASRGTPIDLAALERQIEALDGGRDAAARALEIARRLHRWRQEMTHG